MYNDHIVKHWEPNNTLGYTQKDLFLVITIIFGTLLIYTTYRILLPWKKFYSIFWWFDGKSKTTITTLFNSLQDLDIF